MSKKPTRTRKVGRSAKDGRFVTKKYVKDHPSTTVTDTVPVRK